MVILCTGVVDHYPHFEGWEEYVGRSMFWCITCDGYACKGQRVVVLGATNDAATLALQLRRFTDQLTLLTDSHNARIGDQCLARLQRAGIPLIVDRLAAVEGHNGLVQQIYTQGGRSLRVDQIFSHHGATPQTELARQLGVQLAANGYIETDAEQRTSVPGVFAAGDVTRMFSHQVATAVHEGGQAASAANYDLYPPDLRDI
jgi:thioredoxin reductase (NADPH)